jgi:triacylglycerol lipase
VIGWLLVWTILATPAIGEHVVWAQDALLEGDPEAVPVLVVPGWGDEAPDVEPLVRRLVDHGWSEVRVQALTFENPVGSNQENAREIARAVEVLRGLTGADRVDLVAHSMGGLAVRHYLLFEGGEDRVRRVVFLATPHRGSVAAVLAWGDGGREMVPGSDFLRRLNEGGIPEGVEALSIRTPVDLRVIPGSSAVLLGALNLEICCPTHNQLVEEDRTGEAVVGFLREGASGVPDAERAQIRVRSNLRARSPFELWRPLDDPRLRRTGDAWYEDAWASERWGMTWDEIWDEVRGDGWGNEWARRMLRRWFLPSTDALVGEGRKDPRGWDGKGG